MTTTMRRRRLPVLLGLAVLASSAFALTGGSPALASPTDPMGMSQIKICTGGDDKRTDSRVTLDIDTLKGTVQVVVSPDHQNSRYNDNTCTATSINLFPIAPTDITGFRLEWVRGTDCCLGNDSWWFTGLAITGMNSSFEFVELLDAIGVKHKFETDETFGLPRPPVLRGTFFGTLVPPTQAPVGIQVDFVGFGGSVTATVTIPAPLFLNICGRDGATKPTVVMLTGGRTGFDASGASDYELIGPLPPMGDIAVSLKADFTLSPDGKMITGTVTLIDLPFDWCGAPVMRFDLSQRG